MKNNEIMTLEEVAEYLRVKPQTIYTWAQEKKIPAAKLGKEWRFKKSIIDEWFLQHIDEKFESIIKKVNNKKFGNGKKET
ncbi:helix-turn-helix domain-containing protein [candidate division KSB1 bacterium]|nr:helix-turn-helix domain-containing protein [candidate division KSB1 bacterium]